MSRIAKIASIIIPSQKPPILFDDFNRADSLTLGTAITGQAWYGQYNKFGIVNNKMLVNYKTDGISNNLRITHNGDPGAIAVSVDITVINTVAGNVRIWFGGRTETGWSYGLRFGIGFDATNITGLSAMRVNSRYTQQEI